MEKFRNRFRNKPEVSAEDAAKQTISKITHEAMHLFKKNASTFRGAVRYTIVESVPEKEQVPNIQYPATITGTVLVSGIKKGIPTFNFTVRRLSSNTPAPIETAAIETISTDELPDWKNFTVTVGRQVECTGINPQVAATIFEQLFSAHPEIPGVLRYTDELLAVFGKPTREEGFMEVANLQLGVASHPEYINQYGLRNSSQ